MQNQFIAQPENAKALFLCFDFPTWNQAKMWSYVSSFLVYHEGRKFLDCELQILAHDYTEAKNDLLIRNLTYGRFFDLILVWLPHANVSSRSIRALKSVSNHLVFLLIESLVYTKQDITELPHLANRWSEITSLLTSETCVICLCPLTARLLRKRGFNAVHVFGFWPEQLPKGIEHKERTFNYAFAASLYNETRRSVASRVGQIEIDLCLHRLEIQDDPKETAKFDLLMIRLKEIDERLEGRSPFCRSALCDEIAEIRKTLWEEYLRIISKADFMITLPSYFKGTPGRVIEARMCRVPVIFYQTNLDRIDREQLNKINGLFFAREEGLAKIIVDLYKANESQTNCMDAFPLEVFPTVERILTRIRSEPIKVCQPNAFQKLKRLFLKKWTT